MLLSSELVTNSIQHSNSATNEASRSGHLVVVRVSFWVVVAVPDVAWRVML